MMAGADIPSPNLWIKFQNLVLLITKEIIEERGDNFLFFITESCNSEIKTIVLLDVKFRPAILSVPIFSFQ